MCFDLDTGKVVTRRVIEALPIPDRLTKRVNEWVKTTRGEKYSDCVEFCSRENQLFGWENKELGETLTEVEEPIYPDILAKIPGVVLKSDFADNGDTITTPPPPMYAKRAAAALSNAVIPKYTGVDKEFTGVDRPLKGVYNTVLSYHTCQHTSRTR